MSKLRLTISMSLDGFVAGPSQSVEDPLGIGGMALHEWVFPLAAWRGQRSRHCCDIGIRFWRRARPWKRCCLCSNIQERFMWP